jgi:hypothetical protein
MWHGQSLAFLAQDAEPIGVIADFVSKAFALGTAKPHPLTPLDSPRERCRSENTFGTAQTLEAASARWMLRGETSSSFAMRFVSYA